MSQDISLLGAVYSAVPGVLLPKQGGGTALFTDVTPTTAVASDVAQGKIFFDASGDQKIGTASGGGGGGLEYETGVYTPTADISRPAINFAKTHTEAPILVAMSDVGTASDSTANSNVLFVFWDPYKIFGAGYPYSTSALRYAIAYFSYRGTSSTSASSVMISHNSDSTTESSSSYTRYWASPTDFHPYSNSNSRYWRGGRTYKWIAVWKPTT